MKSLKQILRYAAFTLLCCGTTMLVSSCNKTENDSSGMKDVAISLLIDEELTRAFVDDNTHTVNRLLIIPFKKTSEGATNDDVNFIPSYSFVEQIDITQFPLNNAIVNLPVGTTHKILILGFNSSDYNFSDRTNPANRFDIGSINTPTTLANFHVYPKSPTVVPEFFSCICDVYNGATLVGSTFKPEQGYSLRGNLKRIVSGLSVTITNIPSYVTSIALAAENLTRATKASNGSALLSQTTGDGGSRLFENKVPDAAKSVSFHKFLLPVPAANKTRLFLDVKVGVLTTRYTVKVLNDGIVSSSNKYTFLPNNAINISGNYSQIDSGLQIDCQINLDDNKWDGLH